MTIKKNSLGPHDENADFFIAQAGTEGMKAPDYDRELLEIVGETKLQLIGSSVISEVTRALRMPAGISDEYKFQKLLDILCDSNEGKLRIGEKTIKILESSDISEKELEIAKRLVMGKINLEIRMKITPVLNEMEGVTDKTRQELNS